MLTRLYLAAIAFMFLGFGLWSLFDPAGMTSQLGVEVGGPNGLFEMRGVYGGISLGAAIMAAAGALKPSMRRPALWFIITYMGGYMIGRVGAFALQGAPTSTFMTFIAFEFACLILAVFALRAQST